MAALCWREESLRAGLRASRGPAASSKILSPGWSLGTGLRPQPRCSSDAVWTMWGGRQLQDTQSGVGRDLRQSAAPVPGRASPDLPWMPPGPPSACQQPAKAVPGAPASDQPCAGVPQTSPPQRGHPGSFHMDLVEQRPPPLCRHDPSCQTAVPGQEGVRRAWGEGTAFPIRSVLTGRWAAAGPVRRGGHLTPSLSWTAEQAPRRRTLGPIWHQQIRAL